MVATRTGLQPDCAVSRASAGPGRFASALRGRLPSIAFAGVGGVLSSALNDRLEFRARDFGNFGHESVVPPDG